MSSAAVQLLALDVRVDDGPAALGERDEAGRLRHCDRQPPAQLAEHPGLGLQGERGRRAAGRPDHPAHAAVVVDERHVVLAAGVVGRRLDPDRAQPAHRSAGQGGECGGGTGHRPTVGRGVAPIVEACRPAAELVRPLPTSRSPAPTCCAAASRRAEPDLLARLLADPSTRVLDVADGRTPVDADGSAGAARARAARRPAAGRRSSARTTRARRTSWSGATPPGDGWVTLREIGLQLDDRVGRPDGRGGRAGQLARRASALPALRRADRGRRRPAGRGSAPTRAASTTRAPTRR